MMANGRLEPGAPKTMSRDELRALQTPPEEQQQSNPGCPIAPLWPPGYATTSSS
jgi:hypothetical protein